MVLGVVVLVGLVVIQQAQLIDRPQANAAITSYVHTLATALTRAGAAPGGVAPPIPSSVPVTAEAAQILARDTATLRAFRRWELMKGSIDYGRAAVTVTTGGALPVGSTTWRVQTRIQVERLLMEPDPEGPNAAGEAFDRSFLVTNVDGRWLVAKEEFPDPPEPGLPGTLDFARIPLSQRPGSADWQADLARASKSGPRPA